jgi:uncharacterized RDD family membrane protein YckC
MALDPAEIHYGIRGQKFGPVELRTFVDRLRAGQVAGDDYVWDEDLDDWVQIQRYTTLLESLSDDIPWDLDPEDPRLIATGPATSPPADEVQPAGLPLRLVAFIIDSLVLLVPMMIWTAVFQSFTGSELPTANDMLAAIVEGRDDDYDAMMSIALKHTIGAFTIQGIYHALLESSVWQATLGKRALGICVTDERGERVTLKRAAGRHLGRLLCQFTLFFGYLMILLTARGQGLHDKAAGTLVVRGRR